MGLTDTAVSTADAMQRNVRLVAVHEAFASWLPWLPMLVLFTRGEFGLDGALTLSSIYYLSVVVFEVPSGWMSDRLGRVVTLRIAAVSWCGAHVAFLLGSGSFAVVAVGEIGLAFGFAALSGTNVAFHYDSLEAIGRADDYEARQSHVASVGYASLALSSVVGGAAALVDLRWAFVISFAFCVAQLAVTFLLAEPPSTVGAPAFFPQLRACAGYLQRPFLRWVLGYWVAMVVLAHVAFTLAQPYLTEVLGQTANDLGETPLVVGVQFGLIAVVGAIAARRSSAWRERFGLFGALMFLAVLSGVIITAMALVVSVVVIAVMLGRSVQGAVTGVLLTAAVAPLVAQSQRATYLSMHSLAGRAVYGALLFGTAQTVGDDLQASLAVFAATSWILVVVLYLGWRLVPTGDRLPVPA